MSATNRSNARESHKDDYYVTPEYTVVEFLRAFNEDTGHLRTLRAMEAPVIRDPCAGGDAINPMTYPMVLGKLGLETQSIDIRDDSPALIQADYLNMEPGEPADFIVTNPPFNLAREFIEEALEDTKEGGYVAMLLRLNFFGSQKRKPWWQAHMPSIAYVHAKRPGFWPDKPRKTDATEYMHAVWQKGANPRETRLRIV